MPAPGSVIIPDRGGSTVFSLDRFAILPIQQEPPLPGLNQGGELTHNMGN